MILEMPQDRARRIVFDHVRSNLEVTDTHVVFTIDDVYVVWFTFVLGSWKALLSTKLPDGMYYEVTYSANMHEAYLDAYRKWQNVVIPDGEPRS